MDSILQSVNQAGRASLLRLSQPPQLEVSCFLDRAATALDCWKARPGEILTAICPQQRSYRVRLLEMNDHQVRVVPFAEVPDPEPEIELTLFQALPAKERFELVLQKAVELGAFAIVPFVSHHSISLAERDAGQPKSHRWPEVILRAARQCRRRMIPELSPVLDWRQMLYLFTRFDQVLVCHPAAKAESLLECLQNFAGQRLALVVGPEGGFSAEEISEVQHLGATLTSLGPRILRTETAAIYALSLASACQ